MLMYELNEKEQLIQNSKKIEGLLTIENNSPIWNLIGSISHHDPANCTIFESTWFPIQWIEIHGYEDAKHKDRQFGRLMVSTLEIEDIQMRMLWIGNFN